MRFLRAIGDWALERGRLCLATVGLIGTVLWACADRSSWRRTVRAQFARQILFSGVEAMGLTSRVALLAGASVVAQTQLWLSRFGQTEMLGPILIAVILREVGPLLVCLIVVGRSGTAIATELANMKVRREVNVLEAQGIDPVTYLVMPRMGALVVSVTCLSVLFVAVAFAGGYLVGLLLGVSGDSPALFVRGILRELSFNDVATFAAKTIFPGAMTGAISCVAGLSVGDAVTEVPKAATQAVVRSIVATVVLSALVSVLANV